MLSSIDESLSLLRGDCFIVLVAKVSCELSEIYFLHTGL